MATVVKRVLSGSSNGRQIVVSATTSVVIHTGVSTTSVIDEVYIYAQNNQSADLELNIEWGNSASTTDYMKVFVPAKAGPVLIAPGLPIQGFSSNLVVAATVTATNSLLLSGFVNRITS